MYTDLYMYQDIRQCVVQPRKPVYQHCEYIDRKKENSFLRMHSTTAPSPKHTIFAIYRNTLYFRAKAFHDKNFCVKVFSSDLHE